MDSYSISILLLAALTSLNRGACNKSFERSPKLLLPITKNESIHFTTLNIRDSMLFTINPYLY